MSYKIEKNSPHIFLSALHYLCRQDKVPSTAITILRKSVTVVAASQQG